MRTLCIMGGIMLALLFLPGMMHAQGEWFEYFDLYDNDSSIENQGNWELWPGGQTGWVRDDYSYSSPHSLEIGPNSDVVHQYYNYNSGKWLYKTWVYVPSTLSGDTYIIMLSGYDGGGPLTTWAVQSRFRGLTGTFNCQCGNSTEVVGPDLVFDTWIPVWIFIDLDEDWVQVYYNGILLDSDLVADNPTYGGGYPWTEGVFGGETNAASIAAVDLFSDNASEVYWDNLMLLNGNTSRFDLRVSTTPTVRFEYDVYPGVDWGIDSDVWLVAFTPQGLLSYTGSGPLLGWQTGISPMATGPLGINFGVPLDIPGLPPAYWGNWTVHLAVDTIGNGQPDTGDIWDWVQESFTYP